MIGAMKREPQDLDISLKERLTHSELSHIIDFFNLNYELTSDDYKFEEDDLEVETWLLMSQQLKQY